MDSGRPTLDLQGPPGNRLPRNGSRISSQDLENPRQGHRFFDRHAKGGDGRPGVEALFLLAVGSTCIKASQIVITVAAALAPHAAIDPAWTRAYAVGSREVGKHDGFVRCRDQP